MVSIKCECNERYEAKIDSFNLFQEIKSYFEEEVSRGAYEDVPVKKPLQVLDDHKNVVTQWYPTKWYKCNVCGTLWAFLHPEFPAKGSVYKLDTSGNIRPDSIFCKEFKQNI